MNGNDLIVWASIEKENSSVFNTNNIFAICLDLEHSIDRFPKKTNENKAEKELNKSTTHNHTQISISRKREGEVDEHSQ